MYKHFVEFPCKGQGQSLYSWTWSCRQDCANTFSQMVVILLRMSWQWLLISFFQGQRSEVMVKGSICRQDCAYMYIFTPIIIKLYTIIVSALLNFKVTVQKLRSISQRNHLWALNKTETSSLLWGVARLSNLFDYAKIMKFTHSLQILISTIDGDMSVLDQWV